MEVNAIGEWERIDDLETPWENTEEKVGTHAARFENGGDDTVGSGLPAYEYSFTERQNVVYEDAYQRGGMTVEGCIVAETAWELAKEKGVEMPIVEQLNLVLYQNKDIHLAVHDLMDRPCRHENEKIWLQEKPLRTGR